MLRRRDFLLTAVSALTTANATAWSQSRSLPAPIDAAQATGKWLMPDEAAPHAATWMAFRASSKVWTSRLAGPALDALALIANTIVRFEPVNMLVGAADVATARQKCDPRIKIVPCALDDLWMRDTGPVFVTDGQTLAGVDFNFNGWGNKQAHGNDTKVAALVTRNANATRLSTPIVLEGGAIEVDGIGTAIITESCVLNANRNPGLSKSACEVALRTRLGVRKVIWLPGIAGRDITDGHTDFYARFARPGVVVAHVDPDPASYDYAVTRRHLDILRTATDVNGKALRIVELLAPQRTRGTHRADSFAAGYVNFYVINGAVIMPEFGDASADAQAKRRVAAVFPGRTVVQLNIDAIAAGGGGVHCTTQQQPKLAVSGAVTARTLRDDSDK